MSDRKILDSLCALRERIQADGAWGEDHTPLMYDTAKTLGFDDLDAAFIAGDWGELYRQVTLLRRAAQPSVPQAVRAAIYECLVQLTQYQSGNPFVGEPETPEMLAVCAWLDSLPQPEVATC